MEAIPVWAEGGSFPSIAGDDSIARIFALPRERQPLFLLLCRNVMPASDLEETFERLGNLLPGGSRQERDFVGLDVGRGGWFLLLLLL